MTRIFQVSKIDKSQKMKEISLHKLNQNKPIRKLKRRWEDIEDEYLWHYLLNGCKMIPQELTVNKTEHQIVSKVSKFYNTITFGVKMFLNEEQKCL